MEIVKGCVEVPLVTAVITTFGRKIEYLSRSISSVENQTYENIELVVVDDNGSHYSELQSEIKRLLANVSIRCLLIEHTANLGAQQSRNDGIKAANGEYIAFLDDDDEWLPIKIEMQMEEVFKGAQVIYSNGYTRAGDKEVLYRPKALFNESVCYKDMLLYDYIGTTTQVLVARKSIFDAGLFDPSQPARQDYEMWIRLSKGAKCRGIAKPLFVHYIHEGDQISKDLKWIACGYENIYSKNHAAYVDFPGCALQLILTQISIARIRKMPMQLISYFLKWIFCFTKSLFFDRRNLRRFIELRRSIKSSRTQ